MAAHALAGQDRLDVPDEIRVVGRGGLRQAREEHATERQRTQRGRGGDDDAGEFS